MTGRAGRTPVAVLGATGAVGQRFVQLLQDHPWFRLEALVGDDSAGKAYGEAVQWLPDAPLSPAVAALRVVRLDALEPRRDVPVVFSAIPAGVAGPVESRLAGLGFKVFTNARDHRMDADVPLLMPELNAGHIELVQSQKGPGWIVANGNCSSITLQMPLAALHRALGVEWVHVTTMQGLSGAGYPGVPSLDILDNIVPFIPGEEEKMASEPNRTLGALRGGRVEPAAIPIFATCTRAAVRDGHLESVHLRLAQPATQADVVAILASFRGPEEVQRLPSSPKAPIHVLAEKDRPQPRRDREREGGMAVTVGRVRVAPDGRTVRLLVLGHNTLRGAAGQSVQNAELALARGLL